MMNDQRNYKSHFAIQAERERNMVAASVIGFTFLAGAMLGACVILVVA